MAYTSKPLDTSQIALSKNLTELIEKLARNTHEVWAAQRSADGWTYGPNRDDASLKHPGLVPYDELTESEKDYDRVVSLGVVKAILAMGYSISPKD